MLFEQGVPEEVISRVLLSNGPVRTHLVDQTFHFGSDLVLVGRLRDSKKVYNQPKFDAPPPPLPAIKMRTKKLLMSTFLLLLLAVLGLWLRNEVRIDRCLDHGGRWDGDRQVCEGATE
jgi:hypothetical protein